MDHNLHQIDVANQEVAYVGARAEVMQLMEQRDKMQKQVQEMLKQEQQQDDEYDEQSYYDEEEEEMEAQV